MQVPSAGLRSVSWRDPNEIGIAQHWLGPLECLNAFLA